MNFLLISYKILSYFRDQTTTTEVNMARVYNWGVRKRQSKAQGTSDNKSN